MELKTYFAQDRAGNVIPSATVAIYLTGTNTLATGLRDVNNAGISNPFTATADGKIQFKAADGIYDMVISYGTQTGPRVTIQCLDLTAQKNAAQQAAADAEAARDQMQQIINDAGEQSTLVVLAQPNGAGKIGSKNGGKVEDYLAFVTPQSQGCPCNGVDDDTPKFNTMVQNFRNIYVPPGNYILDINTINVPSNTTIEFHRNAVVTLKTQTASGGSNMTASVFRLVGTSGNPIKRVKISGGQFKAGNDSIVCVGIGSYVSDVTLDSIDCVNLRLLMVLDGTGAYASSTETTRAKNIKALRCTGTCSATPVTVNAFTQFNFVEDAIVEGCNSYGYWFGGMGWGGNSDPASNGAVANERKCKNLVFKNNKAIVHQAGFWISMGMQCDISENDTATITPASSDVGIDFEGCVQCVASNNNVRDFLNGNLATFFYCNQVDFAFNKSIITSDSNRHARLNNNSQDDNATDITFAFNSFKSVGCVAAITQNGAAQNIIFTNNSFDNTVISLIANNNGVLKVLHNEFSFSVIPAQTFNNYSYFAAIAVGAYHGYSGRACGAYVEENLFRSSVAWPANSTPILAVHTSSAKSTFMQIKGGGVLSTGWAKDFIILHRGTSATFGPRFAVDDYRVMAESYITEQSSAASYPQGLVNARDQFGRPWPTSPVAGAYMLAGQIFPLLAPTATKRGSYVYTSGVGSAAAVADYQ